MFKKFHLIIEKYQYFINQISFMKKEKAHLVIYKENYQRVENQFDFR